MKLVREDFIDKYRRVLTALILNQTSIDGNMKMKISWNSPGQWSLEKSGNPESLMLFLKLS